jgi:hypothetical protein
METLPELIKQFELQRTDSSRLVSVFRTARTSFRKDAKRPLSHDLGYPGPDINSSIGNMKTDRTNESKF